MTENKLGKQIISLSKKVFRRVHVECEKKTGEDDKFGLFLFPNLIMRKQTNKNTISHHGQCEMHFLFLFRDDLQFNRFTSFSGV